MAFRSIDEVSQPVRTPAPVPELDLAMLDAPAAAGTTPVPQAAPDLDAIMATYRLDDLLDRAPEEVLAESGRRRPVSPDFWR